MVGTNGGLSTFVIFMQRLQLREPRIQTEDFKVSLKVDLLINPEKSLTKKGQR